MDAVMLRVHSKDLHDHLVAEIADCLISGLYTDVEIRCQDGSLSRAHKIVLAAASPYLKKVFLNHKDDEVVGVNLPDFSHASVEALLEVIYNGVVEASLEQLRSLFILAHELCISIPISEDMIQMLDLNLPPLSTFSPKTLPPPLKQRPTLNRKPTASLTASRAPSFCDTAITLMSSPNSPEYVCPICNSRYTNMGNFKQHMKLHDNDQFKEERNQLLNEIVASGFNVTTSLYTCHVCNSTYNHSGNFKQHLLKHERESGSLSAMLMAQSNFMSNSHLADVLQSAMTDRVDHGDTDSAKFQYHCEHCGRGFKHPGNYKQHLASHLKAASTNSSMGAMLADSLKRINASFGMGSPRKKLKVEECDNNSNSTAKASPDNQTSSDKIQRQDYPEVFQTEDDKTKQSFTCKFCGKGFQKMSKLSSHMKIHSAPQDHYRYPCDICGKKFTRPQHVTRHKLLHTGEKPFQCPMCLRRFAREDKCKYHIRAECQRKTNSDEILIQDRLTDINDFTNSSNSSFQEESFDFQSPQVIISD